MNDWLRNPYLWLAVVLLLAFSIPVASVAFRWKWEKRLRSKLPTEALSKLLQSGFTAADTLLGVPQSKLLQAWLELLDANGRTLGKVIYGWRTSIRIEVDGRAYQVHEIRDPLLETALMLDGQSLCSCRRSLLATEPSRFEIPGAGPLTVEGGLKPFFRSDFRIVSAGETVGRVVDTGRFCKGHAVLLLRGEYALPVRAYIMALEYRRMT